jgi:hypothetical protein
LRFGFGVAFVSAAALALTAGFGGEFTGLPHFKQNCASSGNAAPHLLHAKFAGGMSVEFLLVSELTEFLFSKLRPEAESAVQVEPFGREGF